METINNRKYSSVIIGMGIRGSIANSKIFRVRRGNGYYNALLGVRYQDQFAYFVPTSINNPEGQTSRYVLTDAVAAWQALSEPEKQVYNRRSFQKHMSGYNLFVKEYIFSYFYVESLSYYGTRIYGVLLYGNQ